jgi:glycosyltransferase involved in cell wall biosynthesis
MADLCPIAVLVATKNEELNLRRCLEPLDGWAHEIVVVDSRSTDATVEIAEAFGAKVLQFDYKGGWPKKRQWALDNYQWKNDWILLLDADEILLPEIKAEIAAAIKDGQYDGYWLRYNVVFLGRMLRFGGNSLWKLPLFRRGAGRYEVMLEEQTASMGDMEVHEHVIVDGRTAPLKNPVRHENLNSLYRYLEKHNEYSDWDAQVEMSSPLGGLVPSLLGNRTERRRFIKRILLRFPGSAFWVFVIKFILQGGVLDGTPGYIYCWFKAMQVFHIRAKMYEITHCGSPNQTRAQ